MNLLCADIGGTKTLIGIYVLQKGVIVSSHEKKYINRDFESLEKIIEIFIEEIGITSFHSAAFSVAGSIVKGICHLTNITWVIDEKKISEKFSIPKVELLNDVLSNAYGIKELSPDSLYMLRQGVMVDKKNQALISPGTGLGVSGIFYHEEKYYPFATEGGHVDFSPLNEEQVLLFQFLAKRFEHVSVERVLSGQGLVNLYAFILTLKGYSEQKATRERMLSEPRARVITEMAKNKLDPACVKALQMFSEIFGAICGNAALSYWALGGVYLGGGIPPRILSVMDRARFIKAFNEKGRFRKFLENIPIKVICDERAALKGALYIAKKNVA